MTFSSGLIKRFIDFLLPIVLSIIERFFSLLTHYSLDKILILGPLFYFYDPDYVKVLVYLSLFFLVKHIVDDFLSSLFR